MDFSLFLEKFVPKLARKSKQVNQAIWILETTGSEDAAELKATLDAELRLQFSDSKSYEKLLGWEKEVHDPLLKRQLNCLIRAFKQNQVPESLLEKISRQEAAISMSYGNFRPKLDGKTLSENDVRDALKNENDPVKRKRIWEASKEIGKELAPQILALVQLRNEVAKQAGYSDYFQMQLDLQEINEKWLLKTLDELSEKSDQAYGKLIKEIEEAQCNRFQVKKEELGPWAWSDPFCQEDPLDARDLDRLLEGVDIVKSSLSFYERMGINVEPVLKRSDMFERPGKSQHAFCVSMDRATDVRTLNNVRPTIKWLETVLHEFGHAIYDLGYDASLPWLLKEPPHMITTEAMALIAGRQAYSYASLKQLVGSKEERLLKLSDLSCKRRQLIFSRWVLVMTAFESKLYKDPHQDLNSLWWSLVEKYQKIQPPQDRKGKWDWATKYHIGLAPVYYYSYLLGEMFASAIGQALEREIGSPRLDTLQAGAFLQEKLFAPGNRMDWSRLVQHVTGASLSPDAWLKEFA